MCPESLERIYTTCYNVFGVAARKKRALMEFLHKKRSAAENLQMVDYDPRRHELPLTDLGMIFALGNLYYLGEEFIDYTTYKAQYDQRVAEWKDKGYEPSCFDPFRIPASKRWSANTGFLNLCSRLSKFYVPGCTNSFINPLSPPPTAKLFV